MFTVEELATIPLFAELGEKELEFLAGTVEDIHLVPGEYVAPCSPWPPDVVLHGFTISPR